MLGKLEVLEVYEYYDIPRLFVCTNQYGHYYLAVSVSDTDECHTWIYASMTKRRLKAVRTGEVELYSAFKDTEEGCVFRVTTLDTKPDTATTIMCDDVPDKWLPVKGAKLDVSRSKAIPKDTHQIIRAPALPGMQDAAESFDDIIVRAFSEVRIVTGSGTQEFLSSDRMIADPHLDKKFMKLCAKYGLKTNPIIMNLRLMALRKAKKLSHLPPSKKRSGLTSSVSNRISFASELALRLIRIRKGVTLDQILCDPNLAKEFDSLAESMSPGFSSLEYRLAALNVRKRGTFTRIDERVTFESTENVANLRVERIPNVAGIYLFSSDDFPVFINQTDNLRSRLTVHLDNSNKQGLPEWLWLKPLQHSYIPMPSTAATFRRNLEQTEMRERKTFLNFYSKPA